jgi:geranylgeranyl diphosphate synthase, type I
VTLDEYLEMIRCKTGALLRASIEIGALLAGADGQQRSRCRQFGETVGRLFQIRDDMLGVWGESETTGKSTENDIRRKKKSLPIVMALSAADKTDRSALLSIYGQDDLSSDDVLRVQTIFERLGVKERVQKMADEAHRQALTLADSISFTDQGRSDMLALVNFLLERDH